MNSNVMILGGYGHFGQQISNALAKARIPITIVGRTPGPLNKTIHGLKKKYPHTLIDGACFDIHRQLDDMLKKTHPAIVIHTSGPFQNQDDYQIAKICITHGVHYLDIADARSYVRHITTLNEAALEKNVSVISGASSVPGLTSAIMNTYQPLFSECNHLEYGIATAQQTPGGLATTQAILTYAGKEIPPYPGAKSPVFGWQGLHRIKLPVCGPRWQSHCSIPDLDLFPAHYGLKSLEFYGGVESTILHLGLWGLSWLVRWGLPISLPRHATLFYRISKLFHHFGSGKSALYLFLNGKDLENKPKAIKFYLIAQQNHGLNIPTIPAIVLAKKIYRGSYTTPGATPCLGLVSLEELLEEMSDYDITVLREETSPTGNARATSPPLTA